MHFDAALQAAGQINAAVGGVLPVWLLVFSRLLGFIAVAPVLNRKDLPVQAKVGFAMLLTSLLVWVVPVQPPPNGLAANPFVLQIMMNVLIGATLGFVGELVVQVVNAAGDVMNNQVGLSSAMMFDPASRKQAALLETLFVFVGLMVFIQINGLHALIAALTRSFEVFPVLWVQQRLFEVITPQSLIELSANTLTVGVQLMAPVMAVGMGMDLILGILNRTAQQIPVFQLSFGIKPSIGMLVALATLPIFIQMVETYFLRHLKLF